MRVVAGGNHVAHVHVYVVVRFHLDAALRLVLLELLAALLLKLLLVGVAVVVERRYLVHAEKALGVADVSRGVGVEVDYRALLQLARSRADKVVDAAVHAGECEVEQVGIDLVRVVHRGRQRDFHLAALAAHRHLAAVGLREGFQAAVSVAEPFEGVAHLRIVSGGREQAVEAHAPDERREHIARAAAHGQVAAARIGKQALARQNAVPGAALARHRARRLAAGFVGSLVDDSAVLAPVHEHELPLRRREPIRARQLEGVLVAAEGQVELEVQQLAEVPALGVVHD